MSIACKALRLLASVTVMVAVAAPSVASAAGVLRDDEIEGTIRALADPIFGVAGLDPSSIDIYIVGDPKLNAFVAGGQNLFLNSGLLQRTENPQQLAGVIAHETGHIAGGHLSRAAEAQSNASAEAIIGMLLGAAAAVAGAPQLGAAVVAGGMTAAQRGFLAFSRVQEQSADQAAVAFLGSLRQPPDGLLSFLSILARQDATVMRSADVFLRTHPLSRERVAYLEEEAARSPYRDWMPSKETVEAHARMVAKLDGFLSDPADVLARYPADGPIAARYARAVALFRKPDLAAGTKATEALIAAEPKNPWFHELLGQMLFENGKVAEAIAPYREAMRLAPRAVLVRSGLAEALVEQGSPGSLEEASRLLADLRVAEPRNPQIWRLTGVAAGKLGRDAEAALALAEYALLLRRFDDARLQIGRARELIPEGDRLYIRLVDLEQAYDEAWETRPRRARLAPLDPQSLARGAADGALVPADPDSGGNVPAWAKGRFGREP